MHMLAEKVSMTKRHKPVYVWRCVDRTDEVKRIMNEATAALNFGRSVAILFPTHSKIENFVNTCLEATGKPQFDFSQDRQFGNRNYGLLNEHLEKQGIPMQSITNGYGSLVTDSDKIILSTYHSSKGLDFDKVFMPFCNQNWNSQDSENDPRLFMVAMTRSRDELTLSFTVEMNRYIRQFLNNPGACQFIDFKDKAKGPGLFNNNPDNGDDW